MEWAYAFLYSSIDLTQAWSRPCSGGWNTLPSANKLVILSSIALIGFPLYAKNLTVTHADPAFNSQDQHDQPTWNAFLRIHAPQWEVQAPPVHPPDPASMTSDQNSWLHYVQKIFKKENDSRRNCRERCIILRKILNNNIKCIDASTAAIQPINFLVASR